MTYIYEFRIIPDEGDKNYRSLCDMEAERGVIDLNMFLWRKSSVSILIHIQLLGTKVGWFRPDGCWVTIGVVCFAWTYIGSMYILQGCSIATYCHIAMAMESSSRSQDLTNREYLLNFLELAGVSWRFHSPKSRFFSRWSHCHPKPAPKVWESPCCQPREV